MGSAKDAHVFDAFAGASLVLSVFCASIEGNWLDVHLFGVCAIPNWGVGVIVGVCVSRPFCGCFCVGELYTMQMSCICVFVLMYRKESQAHQLKRKHVAVYHPHSQEWRCCAFCSSIVCIEFLRCAVALSAVSADLCRSATV